tara:strand:- start:41202 stop:42395 length:1194 start_codon:yes stop_codon:yes gene_type:complete
MGVPIRLIRTDGEKIPLMAESITMTVDRSVGSMPLPFSGSQRVGLDFNRAKAAIVITGVLTDDGRDKTQTSSASFCFIDFAKTRFNRTWYSAASLVLNAVPIYNKDIIILDALGNEHTFRLTNQAALATSASDIASTGPGNTIVSVPIGNAASAANVASALVLGINSLSHPSGVSAGSQPGFWFNASAEASERDRTQGNCKVKIKQSTHGPHGGNGPTFRGWGGSWFVATASHRSAFDTPAYTVWEKGTVAVGPKSAGDKAMDLYGSLNNMNNSSAEWKENLLPGDWFDTYQENVDDDDAGTGDYIIGIQIPYNSMVKGSNGDYVQRNFFMPTGKNKTKNNKGSESNNSPVDVDFRPWNFGGTKGIKGTVQQFVITYDAGETVYNYQLTFLPVDIII